jgi:hypothetical protein
MPACWQYIVYKTTIWKHIPLSADCLNNCSARKSLNILEYFYRNKRWRKWLIYVTIELVFRVQAAHIEHMQEFDRL